MIQTPRNAGDAASEAAAAARAEGAGRTTGTSGGPVRPADTPEIVARCRSAMARNDGDPRSTAADAVADLWRIDEMIAANFAHSRTLRSAAAWTLPVLVIFAAMLVVGLLAIGNGVVLTVIGALVLFSAVCSGGLALTHLWSAVLLHRRTMAQDAVFRREVGGLVTETTAPTMTRAELLHVLEDLVNNVRQRR
ncbi:MAG TPA: hypothetical protein H9870_06560 [Candidatus Corynebacterium avicola]|uniref:Uncharacterized protein n=1 Tax=Candidatus Corynebacterium avicola TaxID=2838527 RepID=A0A9D1UKJ3_9CORY|nr:hypothetical protein [Candidatus Corynebacterium avicola]